MILPRALFTSDQSMKGSVDKDCHKFKQILVDHIGKCMKT